MSRPRRPSEKLTESRVSHGKWTSDAIIRLTWVTDSVWRGRRHPPSSGTKIERHGWNSGVRGRTLNRSNDRIQFILHFSEDLVTIPSRLWRRTVLVPCVLVL